MAQILAFDYGKLRTGIAVADEEQAIAFGLKTVATGKIFNFLEEYLSREKVNNFVVGKALDTRNQPTHSTPLIEKFISKLKSRYPNIVVTEIDERFTSKIAKQAIAMVRPRKKHPKGLVDEVSATLILQSYLQFNRPQAL